MADEELLGSIDQVAKEIDYFSKKFVESQSLERERNDELMKIRQALEVIAANQLTKREQVAAMIAQGISTQGKNVFMVSNVMDCADALLRNLNKEPKHGN